MNLFKTHAIRWKILFPFYRSILKINAALWELFSQLPSHHVVVPFMKFLVTIKKKQRKLFFSILKIKKEIHQIPLCLVIYNNSPQKKT